MTNPDPVICRPIGFVRSHFTQVDGMPIQAAASQDIARLEVHEDFAPGLRDIDGHVINYKVDSLGFLPDALPPGDPPTAGVPEPASWALMLLGFGGLGAALRARRRTRLA